MGGNGKWGGTEIGDSLTEIGDSLVGAHCTFESGLKILTEAGIRWSFFEELCYIVRLASKPTVE